MNKPFNIRRNDYNNIYVTSDFHYDHQRDFIWTPRGFSTYQEHNKFIEDACDKLTENDLLIYLGDWSLNSTDERSTALLQRIKAHVVFVSGNHDAYHTRFYTKSLNDFCGRQPDTRYAGGGFQILPFTVDKFTSAGKPGVFSTIFPNKEKTITYFGEEFYFRIGNRHYFSRHMAPMIWDKMKYSNYCSLVGHSHGNLTIANPSYTNGGKILDVGVDNAIKYNKSAFFKIEEVDAIIDSKSIIIRDHHGDENI